MIVQVARLERDKEDLAAQLQSGDPARDGKRVEALLREKAQLHQAQRTGGRGHWTQGGEK